VDACWPECVIRGEDDKVSSVGPQSQFYQDGADSVHAQITFIHVAEQWMVRLIFMRLIGSLKAQLST